MCIASKKCVVICVTIFLFSCLRIDLVVYKFMTEMAINFKQTTSTAALLKECVMFIVHTLAGNACIIFTAVT